jgi:hypothetical protein
LLPLNFLEKTEAIVWRRSAQYCGAVVCGLADEHIAEHQAGTVARHKRDTSKPIAARLAKQCERKRQRLDLDSGPAVGA